LSQGVEKNTAWCFLQGIILSGCTKSHPGLGNQEVTTPYGSRAEGFWNDVGVSSHTIRSVHAQQRDKLKTTTVSHGTTLEHSSIFTSDPTPENPPKRYFVENVQ